MKKTILSIAIIAVAFLAASCQKENLQENIAPEGSASVFTATIESGASTKTTVERVTSPSVAYKTYWESTDKISINGVTYTATPDATDATKATFTKDSGDDPTGTYKAYLPASLYNGTTATLPANYTYADGKYNMPMYAQSTTQTLSFKNICAVLAIKVTRADITALKSIKVKADKKLNGKFTVNSTTDGGYKAEIATDDTDGTNEVVLSMGETAINLTTDGTTFYIAIPAQDYSYLKIYLSGNDNLYKKAMITKKAAGLTIACNTIYNIDYQTNAVQLYADGPYWATMNLGATTVAGSGRTCYGDYYAWGETEPYYATKTWDGTNNTWSFTWKTDKNSGYAWQSYCGQSSFTEWTTKPYDDTSKNLTGTYDAATVNWGAAWKMPTGGASGQFKALNDNTTSDWTDSYNSTGVKGRTFTGKDSYSDIELFFPAASCVSNTSITMLGSFGFYWSSSLITSGTTNSAYDLNINVNQVKPQSDHNRYYGFSVRPLSD